MNVDAEKDGGRDWDSASQVRAASYLAVILQKDEEELRDLLLKIDGNCCA